MSRLDRDTLGSALKAGLDINSAGPNPECIDEQLRKLYDGYAADDIPEGYLEAALDRPRWRLK